MSEQRFKNERLFKIREEQRDERGAVVEIRNAVESLALRMAGRVEELSALGFPREAAKVSAVIGILMGADAAVTRAAEEIRKHG